MSETSISRYAEDFPEGTVCSDFQDPHTGLRGMVVRGPYSFCAYVGAPENHVLYAMEELDFRCHFSITFSGPGEEGAVLPAGWYFFGWDYAHFTDRLVMPEDMRRMLAETDAPDFLRDSLTRNKSGKHWSVEEVVEDVLDVLVELREALEASGQFAQALRFSASKNAR